MTHRQPDWAPLERELAEWACRGMTLPLWWRDDDAIAVGPALERLTDMARAHDIPVHLAIIPNGATQRLADYVADTKYLIPVVHGWAHQNHAPASDKKAEFGDHRPLAAMLRDAAAGLERLGQLTGPRLTAMFVPPWNRVSPRLITGLQRLGYTSLSTFTPRTAPMAAPGLAQINTHLDPVAWKDGRGLADADVLIAGLVQQLKDRRDGRADNDEPYGILTHHLVHDPATWGFIDDLLSRLIAGPVTIRAADTPKDKGHFE